MRAKVNGSQGRLVGGGNEPAGKTSEPVHVSTFWSTILWELLAIGLVGLATYLIVSLVVWLALALG